MSTSPQRWKVVPRFAEEAVERARLEVVPRVRARAPRVPFVILVSAVLLAGTVGLLLFNTSMQQAAFTGAALEERAEVLTARQQTLKGEVEQLRDPQRLAEAAVAQGMVPAVTPAILDLREGAVVVQGEPASADDALDVSTPEPAKPSVLTPAPIVREVPAETVAPEQPATPEQGAAQGAEQGAAQDGAPTAQQQEQQGVEAPQQQGQQQGQQQAP
ncbi:hypothetical protein RDV89_15565 [Nocardioides zeae]|uniref:Cell division protein FtsL n=1 Tax=Nocardioides imazamoxiresistens TaxID=3231893 RepID=A0ABU3PZ41_9ACTN|nr:hypothetical protein [Nocardioides zeae]MDT9594502.1 hypothetical protein [Nocardioides zeae]